MAEIQLDDVWKVYADGTVAVRALTLNIADGEFMVFVGPSGCGKTTALRMVAGLEDISSGEVRIGGRRVNDMPSRDRDVAMVFQNYALYPHLTVAENIGFGLRLRKVDKTEVNRRVRHAATLLGIEDLLARRPRALSGGQRQRVAMGRAIVREPAAFLMDEPLSNLDAKLRVQTRAEILRLQKDLGVTTLYVTHDQVEAMTMGDRVAVMRKGVVQQVDPPERLYDAPVNVFVAGFIGSPAMNLVEARLERAEDGTILATFGAHAVTLPPSVVQARPALEAYIGRSVIIGIRPEEFEDAAVAGRRGGETELPTLPITVDLVEKLGAEILVHFTLDVPPVLTEDTRELAEEASVTTTDATARSPFVARVSPRSSVSVGDAARLVVDIARAHFFDPDNGLAITTSPPETTARADAGVLTKEAAS
jgi:multiple sugar transport system ATP-binding protein